MARTIAHHIDIDAPPAVVWSHLVDTASYGEWNPFVRQLRGELNTGETLTVRLAPPGCRAVTIKPTVTTAAPERELRWVGHLLVPGLFDGEHGFRLDALPDGRTRLVQFENFRGLLVGLLGATLERTRVGFEQMNRALKQRAETGV